MHAHTPRVSGLSDRELVARFAGAVRALERGGKPRATRGRRGALGSHAASDHNLRLAAEAAGVPGTRDCCPGHLPRRRAQQALPTRPTRTRRTRPHLDV
jgi:hypothetical protein